ncbi:AAA family ATPase [Mycolicibacterium sp. S2-37]|uniref:helix-turn-helix transcriptional regulator n=1 Tax=Mycolicibacterium sp. S2-37 TaxID=2810297 RepID=UPI001A9502B0|nr:helix-turn-helix transcriptional regulator [Mycolicibacterium sp. S2-37]MBO0679131.1 AAA family ATPase [Mycolicibacterium sp. S2-37]
MLAGREAEIGHLVSIIDDARRGIGRVVVIRGEAGVGKSALLAAAASGARMTMLRTRGVEPEADLPFAALHRLLKPALDHVDRLPAPQAHALRCAFGMESGQADDRFLVSLAVLNLLGEIAPVLVVIDDAHWLDSASAQALAFAARRLDAESVAMALAVRDGMTGLPFDDLPSLQLSPLGATAAAELLAAAVGTEVHPDVCVLLTTATGGNALALLELAHTLDADHLSGRRPLPVPLPVTTHMEETFLHQVRQLPAPTRRLLLAAAADDTGRLPTILAAASALGADAAALGAAERAGIVRVADGVVEFRHPLVRSAIYRGALFSDRQAVHLALADALDADADPDRRAWHRAAAAVEPDTSLADDLARAAARADQRGAFAASSTAFERSADLTPDSDLRARRLAHSAERAWRAGQHERAAAVLERARPLTMSPGTRAHVESLTGMAQLAAGMSTAAYRTVRDAAAHVAAISPGQALTLLLFAAEAASNATDADAVVSLGALAAELDTGDSVSEQFAVDVLSGTADHFAGRPAAAVPALTRAVQVAEALTDPALLMVAGRAGFYLGDDDAAHAFSARAVSLARDSGDIGVIPIAGARTGLTDLLAGRWAAGEAAASEAVALAEAIGQPGISGHGLACLALHAALRGEADACRSFAVRAQTIAAGRPMSFVEDWVRWALGLLDLGRDEPAAAFGRLRDIRHPVVLMWASFDRIESACRSGDHTIAREWLAHLDTTAAETQQPWMQARAAHAHALVDGDLDAYAAALDRHRYAARPFERARTALDHGAALRRDRKRTAAREHLQQAFAAFDALGAHPWAERAQVELRACGRSVRRRDDTEFARLTPQETQVAGFVVQGLTNADVATKLFLSRRTIDFHLRNVYTKLGVTSRTELARVLAGSTTAS